MSEMHQRQWACPTYTGIMNQVLTHTLENHTNMEIYEHKRIYSNRNDMDRVD